MYSSEKWQMVNISSYAGKRADYVQGGGGNTSVKFDGRLMAIKASGYTLKEITADNGYVTVDYPNIRQYYNEVDALASTDFEKESLEVNLSSIVVLDGMESKRPSVEVGFHSFLKKCVIHTHSVYSNVLCCSVQGPQEAQALFRDSGISWAFIPYIDPGFRLTLAVKKAAWAAEVYPDVIFLNNHGIIISSDDDVSAIHLHENINDRIKNHYGLPDYPQPKIKKTQTGYAGDTDYMKAFIAHNSADEAYFNSLKLYPDQLVYTGGKIGDTIRIEQGGIVYRTGEKEAQAIEETLLGVVYVIDAIKKAGLTLKQMQDEDAAFINSWESEKYRAKLVK